MHRPELDDLPEFEDGRSFHNNSLFLYSFEDGDQVEGPYFAWQFQNAGWDALSIGKRAERESVAERNRDLMTTEEWLENYEHDFIRAGPYPEDLEGEAEHYDNVAYRDGLFPGPSEFGWRGWAFTTAWYDRLILQARNESGIIHDSVWEDNRQGQQDGLVVIPDVDEGPVSLPFQAGGAL